MDYLRLMQQFRRVYNNINVNNICIRCLKYIFYKCFELCNFLFLEYKRQAGDSRSWLLSVYGCLGAAIALLNSRNREKRGLKYIKKIDMDKVISININIPCKMLWWTLQTLCARPCTVIAEYNRTVSIIAEYLFWLT